MQRCRTCGSVMTPTETSCLACGTALKTDNKRAKTARVLKIIMEILFWTAVALGLSAIFFDIGPPWKGSALVALLVRVLASSASQMVEKTD